MLVSLSSRTGSTFGFGSFVTGGTWLGFWGLVIVVMFFFWKEIGVDRLDW